MNADGVKVIMDIILQNIYENVELVQLGCGALHAGMKHDDRTNTVTIISMWGSTCRPCIICVV